DGIRDFHVTGVQTVCCSDLGNAGVGGLLVFAVLTFMVIAYNLDFKIPERSRPVDKSESLDDGFEAVITPDYKSEQIELNPRFNEIGRASCRVREAKRADEVV